MGSKKIIIPTIIFVLAVVGFFLYAHLGPVERTGATLDKNYWYVETPRDDGCYDVTVYGAKKPDEPISQIKVCEDRIKSIEFRQGMLALITRCGRRYTMDIDKNRDFYDNNYCEKGSFVGSLYTSRVTLDDLLEAWPDFEKTLEVRPEYHNTEAEDIWKEPTAVQDIGNNTLLIRIEDDNYVHVVLAKMHEAGFETIKFYENQGPLTVEEWSELQKTYGNVTDATITYTVDIVREEGIKSFGELTKVGENVFLESYWAN